MSMDTKGIKDYISNNRYGNQRRISIDSNGQITMDIKGPRGNNVTSSIQDMKSQKNKFMTSRNSFQPQGMLPSINQRSDDNDYTDYTATQPTPV